MRATLKNLRKVLKVCAEAHNGEFHDWTNEGYFSITSDTPGTICDVQMIMDAFYGKHDTVEVSWGRIFIWLDDTMAYSTRTVNEDLLMLAVPCGTIF